MGPLKNIRHERFCREYIKSGVASVAYRKVYPNARSRGAVWVSAHHLLRHHKVQRRVVTLQEQMMKRSDITIEKILTDYQNALNIAKGQNKASDIVMAAKEQARLVGLLVERKEIGNAGEFEQMTDPADVLAKISEEVGSEAAAALAAAFGLKAEAEETPDTTAQIEGPSPDDTIN